MNSKKSWPYLNPTLSLNKKKHNHRYLKKAVRLLRKKRKWNRYHRFLWMEANRFLIVITWTPSSRTLSLSRTSIPSQLIWRSSLVVTSSRFVTPLTSSYRRFCGTTSVLRPGVRRVVCTGYTMTSGGTPTSRPMRSVNIITSIPRTASISYFKCKNCFRISDI